MIFDAAGRAISDLLSPALRPVMMKTLGLTVLGLVGLWFGLDAAADTFALPFVDGFVDRLPDWAGWLSGAAAVLFGLALAIALALLLGPAMAVMAGFYLDDVAERIEARSYPADPPGQAIPFATSIMLSLKFFVVVALGNLLGLVLLLIPGVNLIVFFVINGYLLGREFFEFAAMRFRPEADAKALRRRHGGKVFLAGLLIAAMLSVPILNLLSPFFGAALMVHMHKLLTAEGPDAVAARQTMRSAA